MIQPGESPGPRLTVVTCMDARIDLTDILREYPGAHVLRNAGGFVSEDTIRSLVVSQFILGTSAIRIIQHTDCGMGKFDEQALRQEILDTTGVEPPFSFGTFTNVDASVRRSMEIIKDSPFVPRKSDIRGYVFDVDTGIIREVLSEVVGPTPRWPGPFLDL